VHPASHIESLDRGVRDRHPLGWGLGVHLGHDGADVEDALDDRLAGAGHRDRPLRRVRQHLARHLDGSPCDLPNLLDLGATLPNKGTTLRGGDDQAKSDWWSWNCARGYQVTQVLFKLVAYECEGLEDGLCVPGDRHNPLRTTAVAYVDLRSALFSKSLHYVSFLAYNASHFFALHYQPNGKGDVGAVSGREV